MKSRMSPFAFPCMLIGTIGMQLAFRRFENARDYYVCNGVADDYSELNNEYRGIWGVAILATKVFTNGSITIALSCVLWLLLTAPPSAPSERQISGKSIDEAVRLLELQVAAPQLPLEKEKIDAARTAIQSLLDYSKK